MLTGHHILRESGTRPLFIDITSSVASVNLLTLATAKYGTIVSATTLIATVASGVTIGPNGANEPFRTGGFPIGSLIRLIMHLGSYVIAKGGNGGAGGYGRNTSPYSTLGQAGGNGVTAILMDDDMMFELYGEVRAGGGGGAGSAGWPGNDGYLWAYDHGGSGGGGGMHGGLGGAGGGHWDSDGANGHAGDDADTSPGEGGSGTSPIPSVQAGGRGGEPGSWGQGTGGGATWVPGGSPGYGIFKAGHTLTWITGQSRVMGPIA